MQAFIAGILVKLLERLTGKFVFFVSRNMETLADNHEVNNLVKDVKKAATQLEVGPDKARHKQELIDAARKLTNALEL